jgi:Carboxypeptidase regulatory-like domain/Bacterial Ig-like domain (group 2)
MSVLRMRRIQVGVAVCLVALAALTAAACSSTPAAATPTPSTPTPTPTPAPVTVSSVVVSGGPSLPGVSFQLTAMAKMSDGTSQDVTSSAKWESSDVTLAVVATTGMVTVNGSGSVTLKATYQNVAGTVQAIVNKPPLPKFSLAGSVWEVDPNAHKVAGARVSITAGADLGAFADSDVNGNYFFSSITAGLVALVATKDGYLLSNSEGITVSGNTLADVFITPTPPRDANGNTATARCSDKSWSWAQTRAEACVSNGGIEYPVCPGVLCPANVTSATPTIRRR